jgi:Alpha/beta hydrolase domain
MRSRARWLALFLTLLLAAPLRAELVALEITRREPFAGGQAFGDVGPYDQITAIARFAIDPRDAHNRDIVDLDLAPKNKDGKVEFAADVVILTPKDPARGNGAILYDVNNRGNKLVLGMFNRAPGGPGPDSKNPAGDGFLMRRGFTVVWSGWIGELLPGDGRLLLQAPQARIDGKLARGIVRYETSTDTPAKSLPLSRREGHGSYPPTTEGEQSGVLTKREYETDKREVVPRERWKRVRMPIPEAQGGVPGTLPQVRLVLEDGFEPGVLYEFICEAEGSIVQGVGFASVRDLISFLRHDATAKNPLRRADGKPAIDRALAFGVSQSGRFLRHFLYLGFDEDEQGRIVFDGLMPHVAGGGLGFFNHRFAQPTRHNAQHDEHLYPTDVFPFTYGPTTDPFTKRTEGILDRCVKQKINPKIMHTQTSAEYWHRSGSLVHTTPDGKADAAIPDNVRIYAFGGCQHGPGDGSIPIAGAPVKGITENAPSTADYRPFLRALLIALHQWVRDGKQPPASFYPKIAAGQLVDWHQDATGFPKIPGVRYPTAIQQPPFADFGPDFRARGLITIEPPAVKGSYRVLVSRSHGRNGSEAGMFMACDADLATFTGWNTRRKAAGAEGALASLIGSCFPLPRTKADRERTRDPRVSIQEIHPTFDHYRLGYRDGLLIGQQNRILLPEDAVALHKIMESRRALFDFPEDK